MVRSGLATMLRANGDLKVMEAHAAANLRSLVHSKQPDVVVIDWDMGLQLPALGFPVVVIADECTRAQLRRALQAGVTAVLDRHVEPERLELAVQAAANDMVLLAEEQMDAFLPATEAEDGDPVAHESLTPREIEVLQLLAAGTSNREIAHKLQLSEHTVKFHVSSILAKLGAESRTQAVARGVREGVIYL
jgi:two-component system, NarL family, response regulator YdfI